MCQKGAKAVHHSACWWCCIPHVSYRSLLTHPIWPDLSLKSFWFPYAKELHTAKYFQLLKAHRNTEKAHELLSNVLCKALDKYSVSLVAQGIHFNSRLFMLGTVPSSLCWCSAWQNEVPMLTEVLHVVVTAEMIINKYLQVPNLKASIVRERCIYELVIMKEWYACFFPFRAIKLLGWVKKACKCCLNDLIFSVFTKMVILCYVCVCIKELMQWFWRLSQDPLLMTSCSFSFQRAVVLLPKTVYENTQSD